MSLLIDENGLAINLENKNNNKNNKTRSQNLCGSTNSPTPMGIHIRPH